LDTDEQKASYAIGQQIGKGMKSQGIVVDSATIAAGIADATSDKPSQMTEPEMQGAIQKMREGLMNKQKKDGDDNLAKGAKYLEENKKKAGVKVTASGLQYEVMTEGKGASPKAENTVKVHYKGT